MSDGRVQEVLEGGVSQGREWGESREEVEGRTTLTQATLGYLLAANTG